MVGRFDRNSSIRLLTWQSDWYFFSFCSFLVVSRLVQNFCHYGITQVFFQSRSIFILKKPTSKKVHFCKKTFRIRHFIIFLNGKKFPTWCHSHYFSDETTSFSLFHMYRLGLGLSTTSKNFFNRTNFERHGHFIFPFLST